MSLSAALFLLLAAPAATPVQAPPPTPDHAATDAAVPPAQEALAFADRDTRMTLPVRIGGSGPHDFIVDTGSERTVISRELAGTLGLAAGRSVKIATMANNARVPTAIIPSITIGSLGGTGIEAPALDQGNIGAPGLLGLDTLQGRALTIDFDKQEMRVAPAIAGKRVVERSDGDVIVVHAKSVLGQLVLTNAFFRGRRIRVVLDTGTAVSVGNIAFRNMVRPGGLKPVSMLSVTGARIIADYTQVASVRIGSMTFANLPIAFADAVAFERLGLVKRPAILLGMDALRMFRRVDIDFANREVRLSIPRDTPRV